MNMHSFVFIGIYFLLCKGTSTLSSYVFECSARFT
jgi:hypothetical protein